MAIFEGGELSAEEIDQRIVALPPATRRRHRDDLPAWYEELARQIAVEALLRREAVARGTAEDPELVATRDEARRQLEIEVCHQKLPQIAFERASGEDLLEEYESRREEMITPEMRRTYHLFLRLSDGETQEGLQARLETLRDRALNGESFARLAAEHSQSETRHREGLIGEVMRGQLTPDLEAVIFGLTEGVPSDPVIDAEGGHIFLVDNVFERRELAFDEVRDRLADQLRIRRRQQAIKEWEETLRLPDGSFVPTREELGTLLQEGDPDTLVLRIGDQEMKLSELRSRVREARRSGEGSRRGNLAAQLLKTEERQAMVLHHCRGQQLIADTEFEDALVKWTENALVPFYRVRRLGEWVQEDRQRLESFYTANPGRFASTPQWQLRRLVVPITDQAATVMARLEQAHAELDGGRLTLEELAAETGGKIEDVGWRTLGGVRRISPRAAGFVSRLQAGQHTPPFRSRGVLNILQAVARKEPQTRPFEEVEEQVLQAYLQQHGQTLDQEMVSEMLTEAGFRVFSERLDDVREVGRRQGEADELVELLDLLDQDTGP